MTCLIFNTRLDITAWLTDMNIQNYSLVPDKKHGFVVNTQTEVNLKNKNLTYFPVKFGTIDSHFVCSSNCLMSLVGAPDIIKGGLYCASSNLGDLQFLPARIDGPPLKTHASIKKQNK